MQALFLNCSSGISGDMFAGALFDLAQSLGLPTAPILAQLNDLDIGPYQVTCTNVKKKGQKACFFKVEYQVQTKARHWPEIGVIIDQGPFSPATKKIAKDIFIKLGEAESLAHGVPLEKVHFHEVGAVDSIVDILAAAALLDLFYTKGLELVVATPVRVGHGQIQISHGPVALPVPAVRHLLSGKPQKVLNVAQELTTPTGAAILSSLQPEFSPEINLEQAVHGWGAGSRDLAWPNVLKVSFGQLVFREDELLLLETNLDDMQPEYAPFVVEKLLQAGAVDAFCQPLYMKKNRCGLILTVLCQPQQKERLLDILFKQTSTLGVRFQKISRCVLDRNIIEIATEYGPVKVKVGTLGGVVRNFAPEYESCRNLAANCGVPWQAIYNEAQYLARKKIFV